MNTQTLPRVQKSKNKMVNNFSVQNTKIYGSNNHKGSVYHKKSLTSLSGYLDIDIFDENNNKDTTLTISDNGLIGIKLEYVAKTTGTYTLRFNRTGNTNVPIEIYDIAIATKLAHQILVTECKEKDTDYRFGFNGKEHDPEFKGKHNVQDYGFRMNDTRSGRFFSVDPLRDKFSWQTPYCQSNNNPVKLIDEDGKGGKIKMIGEGV